MQPTEALMNEHRIIEQVLNCLEKILDRCAVENNLDTRSAMQAIEFFSGFVDGCHHKKEENHLFPLMEANGFSSGCSPVAIMFREHELGRLYIQGMNAALQSYAAGDAESLNWFVQHAQSYLKLIREHIHKEDMCLFPAANHCLTETDRQQLLGVFEKVEADEIGQGVHDRFLRLANELANRLQVPVAAVPVSPHTLSRFGPRHCGQSSARSGADASNSRTMAAGKRVSGKEDFIAEASKTSWPRECDDSSNAQNNIANRPLSITPGRYRMWRRSPARYPAIRDYHLGKPVSRNEILAMLTQAP